DEVVARGGVHALHAQVRRLRECEEEGGLILADVLGLTRLLELLRRIVADRLQHPEATVRMADEALLDQRLQRVEIGSGNLLRGLERTAAGKDGQPREELLLLA